MRFIFVCVFLGVFVPHFSGGLVFRMTNFVCLSYNESWFQFHNCRLKAVSRDRVIVNMNGTILHAAHKIHLRMKVFKKESGFKPWLLDTKLDVCRFVRNNYDPIAKVFFNLVKDFTNFNHTCPYEGLQILNGFYPRPELFLLPFPSGEYMLSFRWLFDQKLQFDTNASFLFVEDLKAT